MSLKVLVMGFTFAPPVGTLPGYSRLPWCVPVASDINDVKSTSSIFKPKFAHVHFLVFFIDFF